MTDVSAAHPENRRAAPEGCVCYLDRLPLTVDERRELQLRIDAAPGSVAAGAQEGFAAPPGFLARPAVNSEDPAPGPLSPPPHVCARRAPPPPLRPPSP